MKISINGQEKEFKDAQNLRSIIEAFCKDPRHVVAEVNGAIIRNLHWEEKTLKDGDVVELVNIVGGG